MTIPRTRVKVCGITRVEDAQEAAAAGVDAIGLVFYPPSPRHVNIEQAQAIVAALPAFVSIVGLFVDEPADSVRQVMSQVPLDVLQFHGNETPDYCRQFQRRYIKAVRMRDGVNLAEQDQRFVHANGLLVDAYDPNLVGGTGKTFDWQRLPKALGNNPLILAGGLNVDNVAEAIQTVQPAAVDVSGGVEQQNPDGTRLGGIKSSSAIHAFMKGVASV